MNKNLKIMVWFKFWQEELQITGRFALLRVISIISLVFGLIGFCGLTCGWMFSADLADILKTFEDIDGFGFDEAIWNAIFIFLEAVLDISLEEEIVGIVLNFGCYFIVLHVDLAGGNYLDWEPLFFRMAFEIWMISWNSTAHCYLLEVFLGININLRNLIVWCL